MIRVAYITKNMPTNGITNVIMNYTSNIDKSEFKITIISGSPIEDVYREQCKKNKINIIELPDKITHSRQYYMSMWRTLGKKFDIVHVHGNSATITVELVMAMLRGTKIRIVHCHNSTGDNIVVHKLLLPILKRVYSQGYACSKLAGNWMFQEKPYIVLPNGFDTKRFTFDSYKRNEVRKKLKVVDKFVIGNVARFNDQKNHPYLLKVFEHVAREREDAVLLLIGNGPDLDNIQALINKHPYNNRIIYYGITDHIEYLYNAMDVFVLPSKYEGLGIVFIEAQINGLPVVTSDRVPREVNICNRVLFLPLTDNVYSWSDAILNSQIINRNEVYEKYTEKISKYDIKKNVAFLEIEYKRLMKEKQY